MDDNFKYALIGCFVGTIVSLGMYKLNSNPFLLFLMPMWGMILAIAIAKVVNAKKFN